MVQALKQDTRSDPGSLPQRDLEPVEPQARQPRRRRWLTALLVALCVAGIIKFATPTTPAPSTISSAPVKRQAVTALGWLEPASNVIKLAAPATVEASRIASLEVKEGDLVEEGQVVAVLDTAEKIRVQLKASEAQVALKRALLRRVRLDTDNSIVARRMALVRAEADFAQAEAEYARQKTLVSREFATPANLEKRKRDLDVAKAQIEEAQAALKRLEAPLGADKAVPIDIAVAEGELLASEAELAQTRMLLKQASIRSPVKGRVLAVLTRPGEKISQDGVMELGSTQSMVAIAEVYQSDLPLISVGQAVELKADTLTSPTTGVVERIALKVKRQSVINNDPATDTDARVVEVRIALDPLSSAKVAGLTRLQVRAYFKLKAH